MEDANSTYPEAFTPTRAAEHLAKEIVFVLFALAGMCADAMIIYILFRFRRMRKTENVFLANWAIADFISLLLTPSCYGIISVLDNISLSREFMCMLTLIGESLHCNVILFVLVTLIDWLLATYWQRLSQKFRYCYKYIIATVWVGSAMSSSITSGYCLVEKYYHYLFAFVIFLGFGMIFLIVVGLQLTRCIQKFCIKKPLDKSTLTLTLVTSFTACWLVGIVTGVAIHAIFYFTFLEVIIEVFIFCTSIVVFILLYKYNTDFQACFLQVLRRSKYEESVCEVENPIVKHTNGNDCVPVQIAFHNPEAGLINNEF